MSTEPGMAGTPATAASAVIGRTLHASDTRHEASEPRVEARSEEEVAWSF